MSIVEKILLLLALPLMMNSHQTDYAFYFKSFKEIQEELLESDYEKSVRKFEEICSEINHVPSIHLALMASASSKNFDCESAEKFLQKAYLNGFEYGKGLGGNFKFTNCEFIVDGLYSESKDVIELRFNTEYKSVLDSMFILDQECRQEFDLEKIERVDSLNMKKLLELMELYGFPSDKLVGHCTSDNVKTMILHFDRDWDNSKFGFILENAFSNGYIQPNELAWIMDRRTLKKTKKKQQYYYEYKKNMFEGLQEKEKEIVNQRRDSIGLHKIK